VVHSWLMVAVSLALWPVAMGPVYGVSAVLLGAAFLYEVHSLYARARRDGEIRTMRLFHGSIIYLTLLFVAVGADALIH
jgi:protoheme IX farnesyltransferase